MAGGPVSHTPVHKGQNYDGNGRLSEAEKAVGVALIGKHPDGKGWKINRSGSKLATLQDASVTKQLARVEKLEKENEDYKSVIKDMGERLKKLEGTK